MLRAPFAFSRLSCCVLFACAVGMAGCDGSAVDTPEPAAEPSAVVDDDGGVLADGGDGPIDGGAPTDGGVVTDGGAVDTDGGLHVDGGEADAGVDVVAPQSGVEVDTLSGTVRGEVDGTLRVFKGIPFAEPPVGDNRLRAPQPVQPWDGLLEADSYGPSCPAPFSVNEGDEDCLTLNIWGHLDDTPRPVMVWIYGGGFLVGETALPTYEGDDLAQDADVVVVSINYRLGLLASLALEELRDEDPLGAMGNMGLLDQVEALRWIKANIAAFGGDPDNITVFGESAGAMSTCALLGTPLADDLFHKAILQSGSCSMVMTPFDDTWTGNSITMSNAYVDELGCGDAEDKLACLRALDVDDFTETADLMAMLGSLLEGGFVVGPTLDGVVLPQTPFERLSSGAAPARPLLAGSNSNEGALFTSADWVITRGGMTDRLEDAMGDRQLAEDVTDLYSIIEFPLAEDAYNAFLGEFMFNCNSYQTVRSLDDDGYYYYLQVGPAVLTTTYGPLHAADVFYVFGDFLGTGIVPTPVDIALSDRFQQAWGSFARTGAPAWGDEPWEKTSSTPDVFGVDLIPGMEDDFRGGRCDALRALGVLP